MKKVIISAFACCLLFSVMLAVSCNKQTQLDIPQDLHVDTDDYLRWKQVENAEYYLVNIDGKEYTVKTNEIDLFEKCTQIKKYPIRVRAVGKTGVSPSDAANYEYEVRTPDGLGLKEKNDGSGYILTVLDKDKLPSKVVIPELVNGMPIVQIESSAFSNCESLTAIRIPDSVIKIGNAAFYSCVNLERISLAANVKSISNLTFGSCKKLENLVFPEGVSQIENDAFNGCESLTEIELPLSLKSLYLSAFLNCPRLKSVHIPKFVEQIFPSGTNLEEITVDDGNKTYYSADNCILTKKDNIVISGGKNAVIPTYASKIGERAFCSSENERIDVPGNIKTIDSEAFGYSSVKEVYLENGVEEILTGAFRNSDIKKITIPESVIKIENGMTFANCYDLEEIIISPENKMFCAESGYILTKDGKTIIAGNITKPIPENATEIGDEAFAGNTEIKSLIIPDNIMKIGTGAFKNCTGLKSIIIPDNVTKIGDEAFINCTELKSVVIGGAATIGEFAFSECCALTDIRFSVKVKEIGQFCLNNSFNVRSLTLSENVVLLNNESLTIGIPQTIYYAEGASIADASRLIRSVMGYDGNFPYVKQVEPAYFVERFVIGDIVIEKTVCEYGGVLFVPERQGYSFKGWSINEDCSTIDYPVLVSEGYEIKEFPFAEIYEAKYTNSPFGEKKFNEYYDPDIKTLYAIWEKVQ